jgi:RNA polymerase sigma-70 factor (ECF subfamily)
LAVTAILLESSVTDDQDADRDLVEAARVGPEREEAFAKLFRCYVGVIDEFFRRKRYPPEERGDLIQETFQRAFIGIMKTQVRIPFRGWLFLMARRVHRDEVRKRRAGSRDGVTVSLNDDAGIAARTPAASTDPEEEALAMERAERVRQSLWDLPPKMRHALEMYLRGDKIREIALAMGITPGAVKAHLHQARERLRKELEPDFGEPGF